MASGKKDKAHLEQLNKEFPMDQLEVLEDQYYSKLESDPKYSISVDPEGKYNMSDTQKEFIANYVQFKNVPLAAKLTDIDERTAMDYFKMYSTKMEIRRINLALCHRSFATKMMNLDEMGGYLTSLVVGENVSEADKIGTRDKFQAIKLMIEINRLKQESMADPNKVIDYNIQDELTELSVDTIKNLINTSKKKKELSEEEIDEREEILNEIKDNNEFLTKEEISQLNTLPTKDLFNILEETNSKLGLNDKLAKAKNKKNSEDDNNVQ